MSLEALQTADVPYNLIRLPLYDRALKTLGRLEPKLHDEVRKSIKQDLESGDLDEIRGTGGWIKGRVGSPSRNIGKSGGFRLIYLLFRVQQDIYLHTIYDHHSKSDLTQSEKRELKAAAEAIKRAYAAKGRRP